MHSSCLIRVVILGFDIIHMGHTFESAQVILKYYQDRGMVPNATLFNTSSPDVLKLLFEYRLPDNQVTTSGNTWAGHADAMC